MDKTRELMNAIESGKMAETLAKFKTVTTIQHDTDLNGATVGQVWLLLPGIPDIAAGLPDDISLAANAVAIKLGALRYHIKRYEMLQQSRLQEIMSDERLQYAIQKGVKICEREMLYEFEGFCHQFKSTLDMLVKVLGPIMGVSAGTISTYGNGGTRVVKFLKGKRKEKRLTPGRIDWLIEEIEKVKEPWLEPMIRIRDTISHYRPYVHFGFEWDDQVGRLRVPMVDQNGLLRPLGQLMEQQSELLIGYSTNFIAIAVSCAIPLKQTIQVLNEMEKRYLGAKWGMDLSRAFWKLGSNVIRQYTEKDIEQAASEYRAQSTDGLSSQE